MCPSTWPLNYYWRIDRENTPRQTTDGATVRAMAPKNLFAHCVLMLIITMFFLIYTIEFPLGMNSMNNYLTITGNNSNSEQVSKMEPPIILGWNLFFGMPIFQFHALRWGLPNCPYNCVHTLNRTFESNASVVIFHGAGWLGVLPTKRRPEQLFTMVSYECPHLSFPHLAHLPDNYFNVSITYHTNSTIPIPYAQFDAITSQTPKEQIWSDDQISNRMSLKKRFALQLVSHCNAPSGRDELTRQLQQLVELDVFGRCNKRPCDREKCYQQQLDSHFFYLAFENSVCPQYVTEKFWNALRSLVVPVVLNRAVLKEIGIPDDAYIAADDFDSIQQMVDYMKSLQKDTQKYMGYFKWTKKYRKDWDHDAKPSALCKLCEIAYKQRQKDKRQSYTVPLEKFWGEKNCRRNFVQNEVFKKDKQ